VQAVGTDEHPAILDYFFAKIEYMVGAAHNNPGTDL
jgi:hypothetical protein